MNSAVYQQGLEGGTRPLSVVSVETFGKRLDHALKIRKKSQRWLEAEAKLTQGHASRLVNDRHHAPEPDTIERIAEALDIDYRWLATGKGEMLVSRRALELDAKQGKPIRFGDLPGWAEAEREARERFDDLPAYAFDRAAGTSGGKPPTKIDAHTVAAFARAWLESSTREERRQAEAEEVARGVKEEDRRAGRATPPPPSAKTIGRAK